MGEHGLQDGFTDHERAAHVRVQRGGQVQPGDQPAFGQVGQVVTGLVRPLAGRAHNRDLAELREQRLQRGPTQPQFVQGRRAEGRQQHIGAGQRLLQGLLTGGRFEVGHRHLHTRVQRGVGARAVLLHRVASGAARRGWGFDLVALGPHRAATHQRRRAGQVQCQAEEPDAAQGLEWCASGGRGVREHTGWVVA